MKNGLEPSMALKACDSPCSLSNLYERFNKLLSEIQRENIERMCVAIRAENTPQTQREAVNRSLFGCKTKGILSPSSSTSSRGKGSIISPLTIDTSYKSSIGDLKFISYKCRNQKIKIYSLFCTIILVCVHTYSSRNL